MIKINVFQRGSEVDRDGFSDEVGVRDCLKGPSSHYKNNIFFDNLKFFLGGFRPHLTVYPLIVCD